MAANDPPGCFSKRCPTTATWQTRPDWYRGDFKSVIRVYFYTHQTLGINLFRIF